VTRHRRVPAGTKADRGLAEAIERWQAAVVRLGALDPVTTELVRLRCAAHHDCHT